MHGGGAPAAVKVLDCCSDSGTLERGITKSAPRQLLGFALAGVLAAATPALAGKRDQSVKFAYDQAPENVDPFFNNVRIGVIISQHVWDTLVYRDPNSGEYKGQLATAWRQVDDKTSSSTSARA